MERSSIVLAMEESSGVPDYAIRLFSFIPSSLVHQTKKVDSGRRSHALALCSSPGINSRACALNIES